jgi:metalloendopeptidase OMA1, mitochondrial
MPVDPYGNHYEDDSSYRPRWDLRRIIVRLIPLIIAVGAAAVTMVRGCQQGPFGRPQVLAVGHKDEAILGLQAFEQVKQQHARNILRGGPLVEVVQKITRRLASATEDPRVLAIAKMPSQSFDWEVEVIRSPEINAFCLPGGKMVVYTGLIPVAQTEGALAAVMGHELAHALAHHGNERMASHDITQKLQMGVAGSVAGMDYEAQRAVMIAFNAGAQYGALLPFSRKHESEADRIGILLMAAAGYDPHEAVELWKRMAKASEGNQPPEFASTHPNTGRRIQDIEGWIPEAMPLFEAKDSKDTLRRLPAPL